MKGLFKIIIIVAASFAMPLFSCSKASEGEISLFKMSGFVLDESSSSPIQGIRVVLSTGDTTMTDVHGGYQFRLTPVDGVLPQSISCEDIDGTRNGSYGPVTMEVNLTTESPSYNAKSGSFDLRFIDIFMSLL